MNPKQDCPPKQSLLTGKSLPCPSTHCPSAHALWKAASLKQRVALVPHLLLKTVFLKSPVKAPTQA